MHYYTLQDDRHAHVVVVDGGSHDRSVSHAHIITSEQQQVHTYVLILYLVLEIRM